MEESVIYHGQYSTFTVRLLLILGNTSILRSHLDHNSVTLDVGYI